MRIDRSSRRFPANSREDSIVGLVAKEPGTRRTILVTTDYRRVFICRLTVLGRYTTPRHTTGTTMTSYSAVHAGREWYGRAAGALLVLRPKR